jgi:hypothetical protein
MRGRLASKVLQLSDPACHGPQLKTTFGGRIEGMLRKLATVESNLIVVCRQNLCELRQLKLPSYSGYYVPNREGSSFTDDHVAELVQLAGIEIVGLENSQVSDLSLESLSKLESLQVLDIDGTVVTDRGISQFRVHPNLQILWAEQCEISDKCVPALLTCKKLAYVSLMDTLLTDSGFDQLEAKGIEVHA